MKELKFVLTPLEILLKLQKWEERLAWYYNIPEKLFHRELLKNIDYTKLFIFLCISTDKIKKKELAQWLEKTEHKIEILDKNGKCNESILFMAKEIKRHYAIM